MRVEVKIEIGGSLLHISEFLRDTTTTQTGGDAARALELDLVSLEGLWWSVRADTDAWMSERGTRGVDGKNRNPQ